MRRCEDVDEQEGLSLPAIPIDVCVEKQDIKPLSVFNRANGKAFLPSNANGKRVCEYCESPLESGHVDRQFCNNKCRAAAWRRRKMLERHGIVEHPLCLHGSFQSYAATYRSKIDVIITDPPYGREYLPLYQDLATFALTTLQAGGWLLCLTGWGLDFEIRQIFNKAGLEYLTVCTYLVPGARLTGEKYTSTGKRTWQQQAKPLLWYQKPGTKLDRRRAGTSDLVRARTNLVVEGTNTGDRAQFHWQQCLDAFKQIAWNFANPQDVLCDPCMGSGTTLVAAYMQNRKHVIGIENDPATFALAQQRVEDVQANNSHA